MPIKLMNVSQYNSEFSMSLLVLHPTDRNLTLYLLMWRIWWAPNNASKGQMRFNSAFKGLFYKIAQYCVTQ